jgi:hypothetical protein
MGEINWPVSVRVHFVAGELDAEPAPMITELIVSFDEQGKGLLAWPADRTKTMLDLIAGDVLVFKITNRFVIDCFSTTPSTPLGIQEQFASARFHTFTVLPWLGLTIRLPSGLKLTLRTLLECPSVSVISSVSVSWPVSASQPSTLSRCRPESRTDSAMTANTYNILYGRAGRRISQIRYNCYLVDRLVRVRSEFVGFGGFFGKVLSRFSTGGSNGLWMINLRKNEPLRTTTSVTKLLCDSW